MSKINKKHKDTVFVSLFSDKKRLLELYNALEGTSYKDTNLININTLSGVLFLDRQNDISFTIGDKIVVLIEHQSSINENMPLRFLMYIARVYEKITEQKDIYKKDLIKIPEPEFIVLYNGIEKFPKEKILKLSDAFEKTGKRKMPQLDLHIRVVNINKGQNIEFEKKSKSLLGYSTFVAKIREFILLGYSQEEAGKMAIDFCIKNKILLNYLKEHGSEVVNMLFTEFNMEDALAVRYEEGFVKGERRGEARGEARGMKKLLALWQKGVPLEKAKKQLRLS